MHQKEASATPHGCEQEGETGACTAATVALSRPYGKIHMVQTDSDHAECDSTLAQYMLWPYVAPGTNDRAATMLHVT